MNHDRSVDTARWVSLLAAFVIGAAAEWRLGLAVGMDPYTAALLPLVLDVYGYAAFRTGYRVHVYTALMVMFTAQAVSHVIELGDAPGWRVALTVAVSAVAPGASLLCHRMGDRRRQEQIGVETAQVTPVTPVDTAPMEATPVVAQEATAVDTVDTGDSGTVSTPAADATPAGVVVDTDDTTSTATAPELTKEEIAAMAVEMRRQNPRRSWGDIAEHIGYSRQWVHRCVRDSGLTV